MAIQQAATDPVTGAIDMDLIQTGVSASERIARGQLAQEIKKLLRSAPLSTLALASLFCLLHCSKLTGHYVSHAACRWCTFRLHVYPTASQSMCQGTNLNTAQQECGNT